MDREFAIFRALPHAIDKINTQRQRQWAITSERLTLFQGSPDKLTFNSFASNPHCVDFNRMEKIARSLCVFRSLLLAVHRREPSHKIGLSPVRCTESFPAAAAARYEVE
jgi:hypothetical protein